MKHKKYPVVFAGAGPGDPDLITVKAMRALGCADLIVYAGSLVPEALLCWKSENAQAVSSAGMDLDEIVETMHKAHQEGKKVVRLHTGDPSLYGAIYEQMRRLDALNVPYETIPGVSAAFAAAAKMNLEFTLPEVTQTLILTRLSGRTPVPEQEHLERLAQHQASMAIYLSVGLVDRVQEILEPNYGAEALCAIAYKVSHPEEQIFHVPIRELAETCKRKNITRTALIVVGKPIEAVVLKSEAAVSKLYDAAFSHGYRSKK